MSRRDDPSGIWALQTNVADGYEFCSVLTDVVEFFSRSDAPFQLVSVRFRRCIRFVSVQQFCSLICLPRRSCQPVIFEVGVSVSLFFRGCHFFRKSWKRRGKSRALGFVLVRNFSLVSQQLPTRFCSPPGGGELQLFSAQCSCLRSFVCFPGISPPKIAPPPWKSRRFSLCGAANPVFFEYRLALL